MYSSFVREYFAAGEFWVIDHESLIFVLLEVKVKIKMYCLDCCALLRDAEIERKPGNGESPFYSAMELLLFRDSRRLRSSCVRVHVEHHGGGASC